MPKIIKKSLVQRPVESMYRLVENVEEYPNFLPWCEGSSSIIQADGSIVATLDIVFKGIPLTFSTINLHNPPNKITMKLSKGPFKSMYGYWEFIEIDKSSCQINFFLEYSFSNFIVEKTTGYIFNELSQSLMDSFIKRSEKNE